MRHGETQTALTERSVREDELDAFLGLMCRSFSLDFASARPIFYSDPFYDPSLKRVLYDEAAKQIVSCLTIVPASFRLPGGMAVPVAGIAGVCTQPQLQRRGHGRALLESTLAALPGLGFPLAALTAESPDLYRRAGFESCSAPIFWQADGTRLLPAYGEGRETRVLSYDQWIREAKPIRALYDRALGARPGAYLRVARRWANIEAPGSRRSIAAWRNQGRLEAYLLFQEKPDDGGITLTVLEMVSDSEAGCRALVGFLARRTGIAALHGQMSSTDFVRFGLHQVTGVETRVEPGMLARVVDLEAILELAAGQEHWGRLLAGSQSGLTVRIEEPRLPWDKKSLRLFAVTDQSGQVRTALAPADELLGDWISLGDHALAQLMTGFRSVRQLHSAEQLRSSGQDALALCEQLFPPSEPFLGLLDAF